MVRKAKTAVGKITEQAKRKEKRALISQSIKLYNEEEKIIKNTENKLSSLFKSKRYSEKKKDELRRKIVEEQNLKIQKARKDARIKYEISKSNIAATSRDRKEEVKRVAKILAERDKVPYMKAIKRAPRSLEDLSGEHINYDRFPNYRDFKKTRDKNIIGNGLDYRLPLSYDAYLRALNEARKTRFVVRYILKLVTKSTLEEEDNTYSTETRTSALFIKSAEMSYELSEGNFNKLIDDKVKEIKKEYGYLNTTAVALIIHFTISLL